LLKGYKRTSILAKIYYHQAQQQFQAPACQETISS